MISKAAILAFYNGIIAVAHRAVGRFIFGRYIVIIHGAGVVLILKNNRVDVRLLRIKPAL